MKRILQIYFLSNLLMCISAYSHSQNVFMAGQIENTISYYPNLELLNNAYYDLNGDNYFDMHIYILTEISGGYTTYNYYVEPMNDFEIVNVVSQTIYPNNFNWHDSSFYFGYEVWYGGLPVDGGEANGYMYARNILNLDTIYSWLYCAGIDDYFTSAASWTPCLNNINIGIDTTINHGDSIVLHAGEGYAYYLWNTGDTTASIIVNTKDFGTGYWTFSVVAGTEFCEYADTINITILTVKPVYFEDKLIVFSNFGNNGFTIKSLTGERIESIVLYNELGQVILNKKPNGNITNISNVKKGLYILEVSTKTWIARKKIVQQ